MIENIKQLNLLPQLKKLSDSYYNHQISFDDYRNQRKDLLKKIDAEYNGKNLFVS